MKERTSVDALLETFFSVTFSALRVLSLRTQGYAECVGSRIQLPLYSATYCCGSGKVLDLQREETVEPWCLVIGA